MPPKKGKKGGKKQDDDWGEDDKKVNFLICATCTARLRLFSVFYHFLKSFSQGSTSDTPSTSTAAKAGFPSSSFTSHELSFLNPTTWLA